MLHYIIEVSLCWLVFYLPYHYWLRKETFFSVNRWYLLGSLIAGLCIPWLELPAMSESGDTPLSIVYQAPVIVRSEWMEITIAPKDDIAQTFPIRALLNAVYWLGFSFAALRFLYGLTRLYVLYRDAEIIPYPGFQLVKTNRPHLPFSFFHLLFQSREIPFIEEEEEQIRRHELAHIKGRHSIDVLIIEFIGIVLWCSPPIYLYRRSIRDIHEYLADAAVLQSTRRQQYSKLLLRQFQSGLQLSLANHFIRSQFKNRINMMTKKRSQNEALLKYLLIFPALITAVFLFAKRTELRWNGEQSVNLFIPDGTVAEDSIRQSVEIMPRFPGCEDKQSTQEKEACAQHQFLTYIYQAILYPVEARKAGIQGSVIASFIIDKEGKIQNPEILKDPGAGLGDEVIRLLKAMPPWIPGQDQGKAVAVKMTLPVKFSLDYNRQTISSPKDPYDNMPIFAGCQDLTDPEEIKRCTASELTNFMTKHLTYPAKARELGIEGKVFVQVTINENGKITDAKVERTVGSGLDEEALRVVKLMPDWKPAQRDGKAVSAKITIPIAFDLPIEHEVVVIGYGMHPDDNQEPRFPGCEDQTDLQAKMNCAQEQFMAYVFRTIKYPAVAKEHNIEGLVVASFEVDEKGTIGNIEILRSLGYGTDEEVKRVLLSMNDMSGKWIPARKEGKNVRAKMTLPVKFALPKDSPAREITPLPLQLKTFTLSPNPNNGQFQLTFEADALPIQIRITDASGKVIREEKLKNFSGRYQEELKLDQYSKGTFFLVITQEGKGQFNHTFIVQ